MPSDLEQYFNKDRADATYVVMIDWDRYDLDLLPQYDGRSIDAIRVVFPHGKYKEGILVGKKIMKKGYKVFFQDSKYFRCIQMRNLKNWQTK